MKQNLIKRPCPTCKTYIGVGFFSSREEIIRCPKCKELLIDNPKRAQTGIIISILGLLICLGLYYLIGVSLIWGFLIASLVISFFISNLTVVKKDLVIRNKQTDKISYIDRTDWNEIQKNSSGSENGFEIVEELR